MPKVSWYARHRTITVTVLGLSAVVVLVWVFEPMDEQHASDLIRSFGAYAWPSVAGLFVWQARGAIDYTIRRLGDRLIKASGGGTTFDFEQTVVASNSTMEDLIRQAARMQQLPTAPPIEESPPIRPDSPPPPPG